MSCSFSLEHVAMRFRIFKLKHSVACVADFNTCFIRLIKHVLKSATQASILLRPQKKESVPHGLSGLLNADKQ